MQQILSGCKEVYSSLNDIIVIAFSKKKHYEKLEVLKTLKKNDVTLNGQKCCFNMVKLQFMSHVLSKHGVAPEKLKIKAVAFAREPRNFSEVCCFLGLVNYCG